MPTHARTTIRAAIVSALTGLATCGSHVYPSRLHPLTASELPAILVTTGAEDMAQPRMMNSAPWQRELMVEIDIVVKAVSGYETTADTILAEIEARLFDTAAHRNLGGLVRTTLLESIGAPDFDDGTDKPVVRVPVFLRVSYST